jgi:hypothetical protein
MLKFSKTGPFEFNLTAGNLVIKAEFSPAAGKVHASSYDGPSGARLNLMDDHASDYMDAVAKASGWAFEEHQRISSGGRTASPAPRKEMAAPMVADTSFEAKPGCIRHPAGTWQGAIERLPPNSVCVASRGDARKCGYMELWGHAEGGYYVVSNGEETPFYWTSKRYGSEPPQWIREF